MVCFLKKLVFAISMLLCVPNQAWSAPALDTKMFSASGISVDVTAENAAKAREQALKEGQKRALMVVMERLTPAYVIEQLPELVPDDIINIVQDMSVSNERTSSVRYIATLEVRFNAEAVRNLLKQNGLPYVRTSGNPLLVLPIYKKSATATPVLWEEDNVWLRSWINRTNESYMMPLFVPLGDIVDAQTLSADQVITGDLEQTKSLAKRYDAQGILVLEMTRKGSSFAVRGFAMDEGTASEIPNFSFTVPLTQNTGRTTALAVKKVVEHLESVWKREQMVQFNEENTLIAMIPVKNLSQWQVIQSRLERTPLVSSFTLQASRVGIMQITLFYAESIERLKSALQKRSLILTILPNGVYKIQPAEEASYLPTKNAPEDPTIVMEQRN